MKRLIGLMLLTVALACAQEPEMFAWWDRPIARNLNLSPEQEQQIRAAVREYRDRLIEQRAAVQIAEGNLRDLMNEDQVNEPKTREAIDKVVAARGELMRTVSQMTLDCASCSPPSNGNASSGSAPPGPRLSAARRL